MIYSLFDCGSITGVKNLAGHARPLQAVIARGSGIPDHFPGRIDERPHVRFFSNRGRIALPLSGGAAEDTLGAHFDDAFHSRERAQFGDPIGCGKHEDCV